MALGDRQQSFWRPFPQEFNSEIFWPVHGRVFCRMKEVVWAIGAVQQSLDRLLKERSIHHG